MDPNCPWNVAPMKPRGETSCEQIFEAVGRALSRWEWMEYWASQLYAYLLGSDSRGAEIGYGALIAFSQRKELLIGAEKAFRFRIEAPFNCVPDLIRQIDKFSPRRNEIAHGMAVEVKGCGIYLAPAWYNSTKFPKLDGRLQTPEFNDGAGRYVYTADQITFYGEQFMRLGWSANTVTLQIMRRWRASSHAISPPLASARSPAIPKTKGNRRLPKSPPRSPGSSTRKKGARKKP